MLFVMCLPVCMNVLITFVDETYFTYGSKVVGGTKVSIEDNKFQDFHTCYLAFKVGSVNTFVILNDL